VKDSSRRLTIKRHVREDPSNGQRRIYRAETESTEMTEMEKQKTHKTGDRRIVFGKEDLFEIRVAVVDSIPVRNRGKIPEGGRMGEGGREGGRERERQRTR